MIDVLIIVLIISGFFITYILVLVCYWWTKEKNANTASNNIQVEWPSEPLEMNLANLSELSVPHAMEVGINRIPTVAVTQSGSNGSEPALASGLYLNSSESSTNTVLQNLRNFTLKINNKNEIIIVDDILNRTNGAFGLDTVKLAFDYSKGFLDMTYDDATKVMLFELVRKPETPDCENGPPLDPFKNEGGDTEFKIEFDVNPVNGSYRRTVKVHPDSSTVEPVVIPSGRKIRICIDPVDTKMYIFEA